ncbi:hypothetical protein PoB_006846700 [Plakobranchus ocellatus]|uniref:Uncharacterized protein n=1 Tax=Plakobranchus ocellatus TaxID=259542 RepID=A0AAV4DD62_9GAST|nr:hypothetical protein PoB_006846700 [Plakobranchus ocellatus]
MWQDCSVDPRCINCRGDHAASSKTCPKFLEEQAIFRYKVENGSTFHRMISTRTYASAIKFQPGNKPAAPPKDSGRGASYAPSKGRNAQKDPPALSSQRAAETEALVKRRAEKSERREAPRETVSRFAPLAVEAEETISSIWGWGVGGGEFLYPPVP